MGRIKLALRILVFVLLAAFVAFYVALSLAVLVALGGGSTELGTWIFRLASGYTNYVIVGAIVLNLLVVAAVVLSSRRRKRRGKPPRPGDAVRARMARRRTAGNVAWRYAERRH